MLTDKRLGLFMVADGMGGHSAGETASRMAVEVIADFIRKTQEQERLTWPFGIDPLISYNGNALRTAIRIANRKIWKEAESEASYSGMGTTVVAALATDGIITLSSIGDSRAYRIRREGIEQLTTDDTWVQAAVDTGILRREDIGNHALRNIITKAVGAEQTVDAPIMEHPISPGDLFLLCSDGLHSMVADSEILEIVRSAEADLPGAVNRLIEAANRSGGKDNITALLIRCQKI